MKQETGDISTCPVAFNKGMQQTTLLISLRLKRNRPVWQFLKKYVYMLQPTIYIVDDFSQRTEDMFTQNLQMNVDNSFIHDE